MKSLVQLSVAVDNDNDDYDNHYIKKTPFTYKMISYIVRMEVARRAVQFFSCIWFLFIHIFCFLSFLYRWKRARKKEYPDESFKVDNMFWNLLTTFTSLTWAVTLSVNSSSLYVVHQKKRTPTVTYLQCQHPSTVLSIQFHRKNIITFI